jgi:vacuolar-type H+-ATPase subunit E/Vma4
VDDIRKGLTPEELTKLIAMLVKENCGQEKGEITIELKKEDLENINKGFIERLKDETKKGILLKPSQDVLGGFIISYDAGKSHYDFTDKALAEYLVTYLKPALKELLGEVV